MSEPIQPKLSKIIRDLFTLWHETMYPSQGKHFTLHSYVPLGAEGNHGEEACLVVADSRGGKKSTYRLPIEEMLSDLDMSVACQNAMAERKVSR